MRSGIDAIGQIPRGTHMCHLFETMQDLCEVLAPYFKAGLDDEEDCLWITRGPQATKQARKALAGIVTDTTRRVRSGQMRFSEITVDSSSSDVLAPVRMIREWITPRLEARAGKKPKPIRIAIDMSALDLSNAEAVAECEADLDSIARESKLAIVCCYPIRTLDASQLLNLTGIHSQVLARRDDEWQLLGARGDGRSKGRAESFERLFEYVSDAIVQLDATGAIVDLNSTTEKMFGYERDEVLGKHFSALGILTHEDALTAMKGFSQSVGTAQNGGAAELRVVRKDGTTFFIEGSSRPIMRGGKVDGLLAIIRDITRRKESETELRDSDERLRAIFESARDAIFLLDKSGTILDSNVKARDVFGYRHDEIVGRKFFEIGVLAPEDIPSAIEGFKLAVASDQLEGMAELRGIRRDGSSVYIEASISPLKQGNKTAGVLAIIRDITERKKADEALRASEDRFKTIFDNTTDEIIYLDEAGTIIDVNQRVKDIFGYEREDIVGKNFAEFGFIDPESLQAMVERFAQVMNDEIDNMTEEFAIQRPDGSTVIVEVNGRHIRLDGEEKGILGVVRDITERREAEKALRESERRFRTMFEGANDAILMMDANGNVLDANTKIMDIVGYDPREIIGKHFSEVGMLNPGDTLYALNRFHQVMRTGHVEERAELTVIHKDGSPVLLELSITPYKKGKQVMGLIAIGRDITERKRTERALLESEGRFRSLIEHSADMIVILDANGMIQYASPSLRYVAGHEPADLLGKSAFDFVHPDHLDPAVRLFEQGKKVPGFKTSVEIQLLRQDGSWRWVELTGRNLLDDPAVQGAVLNFHEIHERKLAEQGLSDSEQRFRSIIENAHDAITLIDANGVILYESPSVERMTGYKPGSLAGSSIEALIHPDDIFNVRRNIVKILSGPGQAESIRLRLRRSDGSWCWLEGVGRNFLDDPKVHAIVCNYRDVTERMRAEDALAKSEQRYRALVENVNEVIFSLDRKGRFTYASPIMEHLSGHDADEVMGQSYTQYVFPADVPKLQDTLQRTLAGDRAPCEFRILHKDGTMRDVRTSSTVIMEDGGPAGLIGVMADITERKKAEEALKESEEKFRNIFENANDVIVYLDEEGAVVDVNWRAEDIFGYKCEELIGKNFAEVPFLGPNTMDQMVERFNRAYAADIRELIDFPATRKDGSTVYIEASTTMVRRSGDKIGLLAIVRDITERKRAEEALLKSYDELEARVEERTAELIEANRELQTEIHERKRIEEALRQSEERYRLVAENTGDFISLTTLDGVFAYVSPSHRKLGYEPSELMATRATLIVHPKDQARLTAAVRDYLREHAAAASRPAEEMPAGHFEYRIKDKWGNWHNLETVSNLVVGDDGEQPFLVHVGRDVTERKQAAEALALSEEKLSTIFRNVRDEILYMDATGMIIDDNGKGMEIAGYGRDEIVGKNFAELPIISKENLSWMLERFENTVKTGEIPEIIEFQVNHKNGRPVHVEASISVAKRGRKVGGLLVILRDITERKRAEEALRESEEKFKTIFENANDEIIYLDRDGTVIDRNIKGEDVCGYTLEEVIGKNIGELTHLLASEQQMATMAELFDRAVTSGDVRGLAEVDLRHKDGSFVFAEASVSPLTREHEMVGILVILRNMTDRKLAEERLRQYANELQEANEELTQYAQVASHDICAPLRAIRYYTHLMRRDLARASVEDSKGYLGTIDKAVLEGEELAEHLLELARIGQRGIRKQKVDVRELLQALVSASGWGEDVQVEMAEEWPIIRTDQTLLRQVFRNLLDNAVKFNHSSPKRIEVGWRPVGKQRYQFYVRDNGIGIASKDQKRIFNIFQRLHHKEDYKGTGIGLAVVKKAAAKLGGSVRVESRPGDGSTFHVTVPKSPG